MPRQVHEALAIRPKSGDRLHFIESLLLLRRQPEHDLADSRFRQTIVTAIPFRRQTSGELLGLHELA